ncbi:MFS transporter [Ancylomarina sp. 16SWW S1-10-2]|uniref:MFS transporter n=1 Tax=Ancylomarina sp. 16SWW S1-10-2 TaxID=2499681 RepID=UPI0012AD249E|nr:MFS transporter [Ancylomarina sp. 16SWW S1-10-2]MRT94553.1 MFS transporter [Ancylomarina sp. 16SWW S1-10-2]
MNSQLKNNQYKKFCTYGFLKNLRFFDAFLILFLIDKNMSYTQIGILYASREIITNLFEIPSGLIADIYGRKKILATALLIFSISFLIFWMSSNFWLFLFAFIIFGLADAFRSGSHKGMMMDYLELNNWAAYKSEYYGHTRSWSQRGSAISALIAGILIFIDGNYQNIFIYSAIPYIINFCLILSYPSAIDRSEKKSKQNSLKNSTKALFQILKQKAVLKLVSTSAFHTAYLKALKDYIQAIMLAIALLLPSITGVDIDRQNGIVIGVLYFIIYLLTAYASQYSSTILKKAPKNLTKKTLLLGLSFGLSCGVFFIYESWVWAFISFTLIFIIENIRKPILSAFVADKVPNELLTSVYSAQSQLRTLFSAIIAFAFGLLADIWGIGVALVIVSGLMLILSISLSFNKVLYNKKQE